MDEKLCPFRKKARWLPNSTDTDAYAQCYTDAYALCYGDFAPCLRERCAMWHEFFKYNKETKKYESAYACGLSVRQ